MAFLSAGGFIGTKCQGRAMSSFAGQRVAVKKSQRVASVTQMKFEISDGEDFDNNGIVIPLSIIAWVVPSSIPAGIPLFNGSGLTQAYWASIADNLSRYPKGPALDDPYWTLMVMWHIGMFACLIFGTIGYNGSKRKSF
ncbi:hypothetical protein NDN08_001881 [Rhodosorus marinus]|uniref:Photosystem I subunit O n=1 Tax=Rhodosorus marinus TaxID=101924 RepID=A0AAV8US32_9RHOD|nr:hypothetical protein NDN08_001881 [Rhodosorus marinus]